MPKQLPARDSNTRNYLITLARGQKQVTPVRRRSTVVLRLESESMRKGLFRLFGRLRSRLLILVAGHILLPDTNHRPGEKIHGA
jgi:hypothetical protein